jgi:hypothetical protein
MLLSTWIVKSQPIFVKEMVKIFQDLSKKREQNGHFALFFLYYCPFGQLPVIFQLGIVKGTIPTSRRYSSDFYQGDRKGLFYPSRREGEMSDMSMC